MRGAVSDGRPYRDSNPLGRLVGMSYMWLVLVAPGLGSTTEVEPVRSREPEVGILGSLCRARSLAGDLKFAGTLWMGGGRAVVESWHCEQDPEFD